MPLKSMPCAICGASEGAVRYKENFNIEDFNHKVFSARRKPDRVHYRILRCPRDGMTWSSPVLAEGEAAQLYAQSSFSYHDEVENLTATYVAALKEVLDTLKPEASILEIGCGNGFVLEALHKKGFRKLKGVEPSWDAVEKSPQHLRREIRVDTFREGIFKADSFDLIYFFQTLDHIYDPNAFIAQCFKLLKPGGQVVAFQHNAESLSARILGELSPIIDVEHIYLFSPRTLKAIFEKQGFTVKQVYSPTNQISLRHLIWLTPLPTGIKERLLKPKWRFLSKPVRLKLGNLCLVGQKCVTPMIKNKKILITGGLGFIGLNAVEHFSRHNQVFVIDDGSRIGCEVGRAFLKKLNIPFYQTDISHWRQLRGIYDQIQPDVILHLAAQVAVTLSLANPMRDFFSNAQGTMHLLELARRSKNKAIFIYSSTNKVYGGAMQKVSLKGDRYVLENPQGYDESTPLAFQTPYGCSKGAADQYVLDYYQSYQVPTAVLRQSCIYGPRQFGFEDQGWMAWFAIGAVLNLPLTVYGDGQQVRDVLYVDDLINCYERCMERIEKIGGQAFNVGGGPENTLSINEAIALIQKRTPQPLAVSKSQWRLGDQKVFICDIRKAKQWLDWAPTVSPQKGLEKLLSWIEANKEIIGRLHDGQQYAGKRIDVSIVIPARNEEVCLPLVLDEVRGFLDSCPYKVEVIVVNDRSSDRTRVVAASYDFVQVIDNTYTSGKGHALRAGFEKARGEYIAMMDADFSHDAMDLVYLVEEVRRHQGLVVASRITGGSQEYTRVRAFGNIVLTWFFGFVHGRYLSDALNGFKIFHKDIFKQFKYTSKDFEIEIELLVNTLRLKRPITEIPSRERSRQGGKVKSSVIKHGTLFALRTFMEKFRR